MVELAADSYDYDSIPFVSASVVTIDSELWDGAIVTAEAIPPSSPISSITSVREPVIPEDQSSGGFTRHYSESGESDGNNDQYVEALEDDLSRTIGAGAAGAILGLLVGGPLTSIIFGFGSVYYTKQEGATGDVARALGDVALVARDKWKEVDSKHHIFDKSREAVNEAVRRIQQADRRHHGRERFFKCVAFCWKCALQYVDQHRLVERGCDQLKLIAEILAEKIQNHNNGIHGCRHQHYHNE